MWGFSPLIQHWALIRVAWCCGISVTCSPFPTAHNRLFREMKTICRLSKTWSEQLGTLESGLRWHNPKLHMPVPASWYFHPVVSGLQPGRFILLNAIPSCQRKAWEVFFQIVNPDWLLWAPREFWEDHGLQLSIPTAYYLMFLWWCCTLEL